MKKVILEVKDLNVKFRLRDNMLHVIRGLNLEIYKGESLAVVGESGSGKSVLMKTILGLLARNGYIDSGEIYYFGKHTFNLAKMTKEKEWLKIRGLEIAMIPQDPMTSLNPLMTIGEQIKEAVLLHTKSNDEKAKRSAIDLLKEVGISKPEIRYNQYPHEFSGGMRQRVIIAIAIALKPNILICDEPTTALDVTMQASILELLQRLKERYQLTTIFITHDFGVVAKVADRIAIMYAGDIIEIGLCEEIFYDSRHPYTWALLSSLPIYAKKEKDVYQMTGTIANLLCEINGDAFAPRNPFALKIDYYEKPPYYYVSPTHKAKTWLLNPKAPKVKPPKFLIKQKGLKRDNKND